MIPMHKTTSVSFLRFMALVGIVGVGLGLFGCATYPSPSPPYPSPSPPGAPSRSFQAVFGDSFNFLTDIEKGLKDPDRYNNVYFCLWASASLRLAEAVTDEKHPEFDAQKLFERAADLALTSPWNVKQQAVVIAYMKKGDMELGKKKRQRFGSLAKGLSSFAGRGGGAEKFKLALRSAFASPSNLDTQAVLEALAFGYQQADVSATREGDTLRVKVEWTGLYSGRGRTMEFTVQRKHGKLQLKHCSGTLAESYFRERLQRLLSHDSSMKR